MEPERCEECGFDATRLTTADATTALRSFGRRWKEMFEDVPEDLLRARPSPDRWSALEYAAHTRDTIAMNSWGMNEVLKGESPSFPEIQPDPPAAVAADHGYNALDPSTVVGELGANAERMAARAERELPEHWGRTGTIGGAEVDADYLLKHVVHELSHHLRDVENGLKQLS